MALLFSSIPLLLDIFEPPIELFPNALLLLLTGLVASFCFLRTGPSFLLGLDSSEDDSLDELLDSLESESELEELDELSSDELELEDEESSEDEVSPDLRFFLPSSSLNFSFFIRTGLSFLSRILSEFLSLDRS